MGLAQLHRMILQMFHQCSLCIVGTCNVSSLQIIQRNLSIIDTLGPDDLGHFLLEYRGFPLLAVKNALVTPAETKIFVLIMEVFSIVS